MTPSLGACTCCTEAQPITSKVLRTINRLVNGSMNSFRFLNLVIRAMEKVYVCCVMGVGFTAYMTLVDPC